ncbi:MAG: M28 family peptidase, partial [Cyanobacteria bacterium]|nr:M28 family peptidase [Cyanobacteriota bacterium]
MMLQPYVSRTANTTKPFYRNNSPRVKFSESPEMKELSQADSSKLKNHVQALSKFFRHSENLKALNLAADYIKKEWTAQGYTVTEDAFKLNGKNYKNMVVSYGPPDAPRFIVGAHYDVQGNQPGADDNASGVAGILELGRLLKQNKPTLTKRIDLVAFTLEEQPNPTMGSTVHANRLKKAGIPVSGMISLEMIGYFSDEPKSQNYPIPTMAAQYPDQGNFIGLIGYKNSFELIQKSQTLFKKGTQLPSHTIYSPINAYGLDRSDHSSFVNTGVPAIMVTDTANFRNNNYHQPSDTWDTLNYNKMSE